MHISNSNAVPFIPQIWSLIKKENEKVTLKIKLSATIKQKLYLLT